MIVNSVTGMGVRRGGQEVALPPPPAPGRPKEYVFESLKNIVSLCVFLGKYRKCSMVDFISKINE